MENRRNYYRILQVQPGAPVEIIRASYRTLMQRLRAHPDLGGDHWNAAVINEAYAVLTDAAKRAEYDREFQARVLDARNDFTPNTAGTTAQTVAPQGLCLFCKAPHQSRPNLHADAVCTVCGSPLHPVTLKRLVADGRRTINRVPRNHPLQLHTRWPHGRSIAAHSRDLSLNGISFVTRELLQPRAIVQVESELCRAVVQVANLRLDDNDADTWLVGAEFLSVIFPQSRGTFLSTQA